MFVAAAICLLVVNLVTFVAFGVDKRRAGQRARRIPERTLLGLAAVGGTPGAFAAQQVLRHKTCKEPFRTRLWLIALAQLGAVALVYVFR